jgi:hypothetical protein
LPKPFDPIYDIHTGAVEMDTNTLRAQIGIGALMTVGARKLIATPNSLEMTVSLHPRLEDGTRSRAARNMELKVTLGGDDLYRISVRYKARGGTEVLTHWELDRLFGPDLPWIFVALDSGTESR